MEAQVVGKGPQQMLHIYSSLQDCLVLHGFVGGKIICDLYSVCCCSYFIIRHV